MGTPYPESARESLVHAGRTYAHCDCWGGIGGLVLGLALRQRGLVAEIFEQSSELTEIGAAVALSANATREIERLGLHDDGDDAGHRSWLMAGFGRPNSSFPS